MDVLIARGAFLNNQAMAAQNHIGAGNRRMPVIRPVFEADFTAGTVLMVRNPRIVFRKYHRRHVRIDTRIPHAQLENFIPVRNREIDAHLKVAIGLPCASRQPVNAPFKFYKGSLFRLEA